MGYRTEDEKAGSILDTVPLVVLAVCRLREMQGKWTYTYQTFHNMKAVKI